MVHDGPSVREAGGVEDTRSAVLLVVAVCLVCSVVVTGTAVVLRPYQERHREAARSVIPILAVAGAYDPSTDSEPPLGRVRGHLVDLATGAYVPAADPFTFDPREAAEDPELAVPIPEDQDLARIGQRARYGPVFIVDAGDAGTRIVLPIHGEGAYSSLAAYLALDDDAVTVHGIDFFEQGETPGLGAQIADPVWGALWRGKKAVDPDGSVRLGVARGLGGDEYEVDGIAGATLTGRAVTAMVRYWLGDHGYGPYLRRVREGEGP